MLVARGKAIRRCMPRILSSKTTPNMQVKNSPQVLRILWVKFSNHFFLTLLPPLET